MRNYITFNNVSSKDYGVYLSGQGVFKAPQKEIEFLPIPGRNGDLLRLNDRWQNIEVTYPAFIYANFDQNVQNFRNFLNSVNGYAKLYDSYHPYEYRLAAYAAEFDPDVLPNNQAGRFDIVFNCKPQRFLTSGDTPFTYSSTTFTMFNAQRFASLPKMEITCPSGSDECTIVLRDQIITIKNPGTKIIIDSEMQDCYWGTANLNDKVSFSDYKFPVLIPGNNTFTIDEGMTVVVTPKWWRI